MYSKEKLQSNKVNAPTLFIGMGGVGSGVIAEVAKKSINDDQSNIRFVVMDTDANTIRDIKKGANVTWIQTSSTRTVESYLTNDREAKDNWFPDNKMLDPKTVSEGAGQIRAISRLAINDIIKTGRIRALYDTIDALFHKDGGGLKQAIRVVIASTAAGGTGSGIAMIVGMLVRHYVKKNYPEAAVMIRGYIVMPGVMDTVIKSQSERDSVRCNGYATIKEINAFMMKGSGFFDTVPELQRYKDLHVAIPSASAGMEKLSDLPFDFCMLLDRTDSNDGNMQTKSQYVDYAAQSIYEQCIGPMSGSASSVEDNVLKLCINPDKMGRCRFAGSGASVLEYPYDEIRDYIALNWTRSSIIGSSAKRDLSEKERKEMLEKSWLQYDKAFDDEYREWEENPNSSSRNEPQLSEVYIRKIESGADSGSGNDFTQMLWDKFLTPKIQMSAPRDDRTAEGVAKNYLDALVSGVSDGQIEREFSLKNDGTTELAENPAASEGYWDRYRAIENIQSVISDSRFEDLVKGFAKEVFSSKTSSMKEDLGEYMLQKFLSVKGHIMHPNAVRYLLYKLAIVIDKRVAESNAVITSFKTLKDSITMGIGSDGSKDISNFQVALSVGKEQSLRDMCEACDKLKSMDGIAGDPGSRCNNLLDEYCSAVKSCFDMSIVNIVCSVARTAVANLIKAYEDFYGTFENKIPSIERSKEDIVTSLSFHNGDCVRKLFCERKHLEKLAASAGRPADSGKDAVKLYAKIFESIRENSYIDARKNSDSLYYSAKTDVFNDIIIQYYRGRVEDTCDTINVKNILQAIKLEYDVKCAIELDGICAEYKDRRATELQSEESLDKYIREILDLCRNLASPGIQKKDNEEPREVNLVACSDSVTDGDGLRKADYIPEAIESSSISKYELHFYRAAYNIMPTQLAKMSSPVYDDTTDEFSVSSENEYEQLSAGDYFRIYQRYMDKIGPDSKTSAVITPHIDARWNAISAMPELDMEYQKRLMRKIHKSMLYGFIYRRINLSKTSDDRQDEKVYKYLNSEDDSIELIVSNKTKCDVLFEVLDALYFDRLAVATIRDYVNKIRIKNIAAGCRSKDDLDFFKKLSSLKFRWFVNDQELNKSEEAVSLFTLVLMYCNSLPVQNKDMAEMKIMVEAIIEMICSEMQICTANKDSLIGKVSDLLVEQFNLLMKNCEDHKDILYRGIFSEEVLVGIYRIVRRFLINKDAETYADKLNSPEEN